MIAASASGLIYLGGALMLRWMWLEVASSSETARTWWREVGVLHDAPSASTPRTLGWSFSWRRSVVAAGIGCFYASPGLTFLLPEEASPTASAPPLVPSLGWAAVSFVVVTGLFLLLLSSGRRMRVDDAPPSMRLPIANVLFGALAIVQWVLVLTVSTILMIFTLGIGEPSADAFAVMPADVSWWRVVLAAGLLLILLGAPVAFFGGAVTLGGRFLVCLLLLGLQGKLPLRLFRFLGWAHDVGLLRRQGSAFSFRHALLRDVLTPDSERSTGTSLTHRP